MNVHYIKYSNISNTYITNWRQEWYILFLRLPHFFNNNNYLICIHTITISFLKHQIFTSKIVNASHLKHVIAINNMISALVDFVWFFFLFFRRKRKTVLLANKIGQSRIFVMNRCGIWLPYQTHTKTWFFYIIF